MKAYVVCYGCGVINNHLCPDGFSRMVLALREAQKLEANGFETKIVLTAGSPKKFFKLFKPNISYFIANELLRFHWPENKILKNPVGEDTVTETKAAIELIRKNGNGSVMVCTSWYHALRVWLLWFFGGVKVRVRVHWDTYQKCPLEICRGPSKRGFWYWLLNEPTRIPISLIKFLFLSS